MSQQPQPKGADRGDTSIGSATSTAAPPSTTTRTTSTAGSAISDAPSCRSTASSSSSGIVFRSSPPPARPIKKALLGDTTKHNVHGTETPRKKVKGDVTSAAATTTTPNRPITNRGRRPPASNSGLFKPFKSPVVQQGLGAASTKARQRVRQASPAGPSSIVAPSPLQRKRSERAQLEDRLRKLKQADKIVRDDSLAVLPHLISKWREAGKAAALDLWRLTGAAEAGEASFSIRPQSAGYDDSEPLPHDCRTRRLNATASPPSSPRSVWLMRRTLSDGTREQTAALKAELEELEELPISSGCSTPPTASELVASLREGGTIKVFNQKRESQSMASVKGEEVGRCNSDEEPSKGIDQKWNVGRMLDLIGVNKKTLHWNASEEEFED